MTCAARVPTGNFSIGGDRILIPPCMPLLRRATRCPLDRDAPWTKPYASLVSDELRALLIDEISKRLAVIEAAPTDLDAALFNVVSLRGSAGLTGETNFASSLARLEPRLRNGEVA